jgi:hypothetical protein
MYMLIHLFCDLGLHVLTSSILQPGAEASPLVAAMTEADLLGKLESSIIKERWVVQHVSNQELLRCSPKRCLQSCSNGLNSHLGHCSSTAHWPVSLI